MPLGPHIAASAAAWLSLRDGSSPEGLRRFFAARGAPRGLVRHSAERALNSITLCAINRLGDALWSEGRRAMRVFKSKSFARFARKARITDAVLCAAIADASRGLVDADLGGGVLKQRIARQGGGKSGGFRTIILFRVRERAFFVHGFAKNEQDNIRDDELAAFKMLAAQMMAYDDEALARAIANETLTEVVCND